MEESEDFSQQAENGSLEQINNLSERRSSWTQHSNEIASPAGRYFFFKFEMQQFLLLVNNLLVFPKVEDEWSSSSSEDMAVQSVHERVTEERTRSL